MSRTLFIGDIHGCYEELVELYGKMDIQADDLVFATGDTINRGPYSQKAVQFLREKNIQSVLGNHEVAFLKGMTDTSSRFDWYDNLAEQFVGHEEDLEYLKSYPYWIERDNFLLIHAGLVPNIAIEKQDQNNLVKVRMHEGKPWHDYYQGDKIIIYGHWAEQGLRFTRNTRGLDSGCLWGGHLTGYCLETGEIWQVRAKKMYGNYWNDDKPEKSL